MSEYTNIKMKIRSILNLMSDETFLGSIDSIDFKNRYIHIKSGYWRTIVTYIKSTFNNELFVLNNVLTNIKNMWFKRISEVSATKFKKFFMHEIKSYYFNFKNIVYYANSLTREVKNYQELRKIRFYEKKAKKYYLYSMKIKELPVYKDTEESDAEAPCLETDPNTNKFSEIPDLEDFEIESEPEIDEDFSDEKIEVLTLAQEYALKVFTEYHTLYDLRMMELEGIFPKPSELDFGEDIDGKHPPEGEVYQTPNFLDLVYRELQSYNRTPKNKIVKYYTDKKIDPKKVEILYHNPKNMRVKTAEKIPDERTIDNFSGQTYYQVVTTSITGQTVNVETQGDMDWTNSFLEEAML